MSFIMPNQSLLIIETDNLEFGTSAQISAKLNLDESVVGSTPTVTATPPTDAPFTLSVSNNTTPNPTINITLTGDIATIDLGLKYQITLSANGQTDSFNIVFLLSKSFDPTDWSNSYNEDTIGHNFIIKQIAESDPVISPLVNKLFKSLSGFISLVNYKAVDIINRYRIKRNLADIVNSAIYAGAIPSGYTGTINYLNDGTTNIDSIILSDALDDSDSYTLIKFHYVTLTSTVTPSGGIPVSTTFQGMDRVTVSRVSNALATTVKYVIATINITRSNLTFTSVVDSTYSVTMPLVTGWTVA